MPGGVTWSQSQREAFWFAERSAREGYSATSALRAYREAGGRISNSYWYELYRELRTQEEVTEKITRIPEEYEIPEEMHLEVPFRYRQEYVYKLKLYGWDVETGEYKERYVTVEADYRLNKYELEWYASEAIDNTIGSLPFAIDYIAEISPMKRISRR